ncbi:ABC transporter permease [Parablautia sp. Marseille-Q6255]|uniref:ABC transporter permease n=1 Tax=Parablautia sp. Marseille-Q6255 TaxID=3039593 RepID=UPI0024BC5A27|nr:ABC transporter permease [Parablautia sp. Marseille-Q6255]
MNIKAAVKRNQSVIFCYLIAFVLFAGFSIYMPGFASLSHIRTVFLESALIGIVAVGQTLVILTGGIDLSVAWMMTIGAYMVSNLTGSSDAKLVWGFPLMLIVTFGLGAINGFCISCLRVPAIVMTLGMNIILQGVLVAMTQGSPGQSAPEFLQMIGQKNVGGIPYLVIIWIVLTGVVMVMLFKMKLNKIAARWPAKAVA